MLDWLNHYQWKWAREKNITKLLGILFGLGLEVKDIDAFLLNKIKKKLPFWCSIHLSLVGKTFIVTQILLSTL
jgi:hypothetical protein